MKASDYKTLAKKQQKIESVELPSGAVFLLRTAPIQQWVTVGILPASLAGKMQIVAKAGKNKESAAQVVIETFSEEDYAKQQELSRKLLEFCCVEPKMSISGEDPDALTPSDIADTDFEFLIQWVWAGGGAGASLNNFHPEPKRR